jgi:hypothetical protein
MFRFFRGRYPVTGLHATKYQYTEVLTFIDRCTAVCDTHTNFADESMPVTVHRSQMVLQNAIPLHEDIPRTSGGGPNLPFQAVLQEYFQFPYEYFLLVLPFGGYSCKICSSNNPRRINHTDQDRVSEIAFHIYYCTVKTYKSIVRPAIPSKIRRSGVNKTYIQVLDVQIILVHQNYAL